MLVPDEMNYVPEKLNQICDMKVPVKIVLIICTSLLKVYRFVTFGSSL